MTTRILIALVVFGLGSYVKSLASDSGLFEQRVGAKSNNGKIKRSYESLESQSAEFIARSSSNETEKEDSNSDDRSPEDPNKCKEKEPIKCDPNYPYRRMNGTCNNLYNPTWGSANECYLRFQPPFYTGYGSVRQSTEGGLLPEPRDLTLNILTNLHRPTPDVNFMFTIYGQTVAYDISHGPALKLSETCCLPENATDPACFPIRVRPDDPFYSQFNVTCLEFRRIQPCSCNTTYREQINDESAVLDTSTIYGLDDSLANTLRANDGTGRLSSNQTSHGELLLSAREPPGKFCVVKPYSECFFTGDQRVNQHASLTGMYTLFMREHNRLAAVLKNLNPHWEEERLYQEARKINGAQLQCIAYKEYLPLLLGPDLMREFNLTVKNGSEGTKYDPKVRIGAWAEFAVAAFRLHSMVATKVGALHLQFRNTYQNPGIIRQGKTKQLMRGVCKVPSEKYDHWYVPDVTDYLGKPPGVPYGVDLSSIDIQRGRDQGIAPYIHLVKFCSGGQIVISSFVDIPAELMPPDNVELLKKNYATVEDVDLYIGVLMENHVPGSQVGPTAACIIARQFYFLKFGDRFYFEHEGEVPSFTPAQRENLKQCSLSRILCDNAGIKKLQKHALLLPSCENPKVVCEQIPQIDLTPWKEEEETTLKIKPILQALLLTILDFVFFII